LNSGGSRLAGRILDSTGGPVAGATLSVRGEVLFQAVSNALGDFVLALPAGTYDVNASADGYASYTKRALSIVGETTVDLMLHPGATVRGVVAQGSQPVAGAEVRLVAMQAGRLWPSQSTFSGEQGVFELHGVDPGEYRLFARKGLLIGRSTPLLLQIAETASITLLVAEGTTLVGRVMSADGKPVSGARVEIVDGAQMKAATFTTGEGRYRLEGLPSGVFDADVAAEGFATLRTRAAVSPLDRVRDFELLQASVVVGTVVDGDARPVPGAVVRLDAATITESSSRTSDELGKFVFTDLPSDSYHLAAATGSMFGSAEVHVSPGEARTVAIRVGRGALLSGKATWREGGAAVGAVVRLLGEASEASVGPDGCYELAAVRPGEHTMSVQRSRRERPLLGVGNATRTIVVSSGEARRDLDFVLDKGGGKIAGVATLSDGLPAARVPVHWGRDCMLRAASALSQSATDADGRFALDDLPAGAHDVCAFPPGLPRAVVRSVATGNTDVRIHLATGATLAGTVADRGGRPCSGCTVRAETRMGGVDAEQTADLTGAFEFRGLGADTYTIRARSDDGQIGEADGVAVVDGESRRGLRVLVALGATVRGRVVEEGGRPLRGAQVQIGGATSFTDGTGSFLVRGVSGREVKLRVSIPRSVSADTRSFVLRDGSESDIGTLRLVLRTRGQARPGFRVDRRPEALLVDEVEPGPAAEAGIHEGDEILSIDGLLASELGDDAIDSLLSGEPRSVVKLEVRSAKDGFVRHLAITRTLAERRKP
jgi:hypothetical protein